MKKNKNKVIEMHCDECGTTYDKAVFKGDCPICGGKPNESKESKEEEIKEGADSNGNGKELEKTK